MATLSKSDLFDVLVEFSEQKQQFIESDKTGGDAPVSISFSLEALLCACQNVEKIQDESTPAIPEDVKEAAGKYYTEHPFSNVIDAFLAGAAHIQKQEEETPIWYTQERMYDWLRQNNYSEQIAKELSVIWARDLQGAFKKGWEKAKNEGKDPDQPYQYYQPLPSNIVEKLEELNPYKGGKGSGAYTGQYHHGYMHCLSKLRELLSSQPVQGNEIDKVRADFAVKLYDIPFYGWGPKGMRENPSSVPSDDVFVLRSSVANIIKSAKPQDKEVGK